MNQERATHLLTQVPAFTKENIDELSILLETSDIQYSFNNQDFIGVKKTKGSFYLLPEFEFLTVIYGELSDYFEDGKSCWMITGSQRFPKQDFEAAIRCFLMRLNSDRPAASIGDANQLNSSEIFVFQSGLSSLIHPYKFLRLASKLGVSTKTYFKDETDFVFIAFHDGISIEELETRSLFWKENKVVPVHAEVMSVLFEKQIKTSGQKQEDWVIQNYPRFSEGFKRIERDIELALVNKRQQYLSAFSTGA
jgi:hypothetical protein